MTDAHPTPEAPATASSDPVDRLHRHPKRLTVYGLLAALLLIADLAFKYWAFANFPPPDEPGPPHIWIPNVLAIQLVHNTGAVFGLGKGYTWLFVIMTVAAAALILTTLLRCRADQRLLPICLVMILAGALGNMYDRLFHPGVRDMLLLFPEVHLPFGLAWPGGETRFYPWIFNLADVYLTLGILLVMAWTLVDGAKQSRTEREPPAAQPHASNPGFDESDPSR